MANAPVPERLSVETLIAAVKKLSPAELRRFEQALVEWQGPNGGRKKAEKKLLARIRANSALPAPEQRRFDRLRNKRRAGALTAAEAAELQALWQQVERMNVARLEALSELASRRGTDVRDLMRELGLAENRALF